jgi:3-deoxy-D-manno-octulosonic-acid transferase
MQVWLYRFAINFYWFGVWALSAANLKAKKLYLGQKSTLRQISQIKRKEGKLLWFHCSSVGEFEQARPLIEHLKSRKPQLIMALSFFSPSGYELRKNYSLADYVFYLPKDNPKNAKLLVEWLMPEAVFFIKYEFWFFFIDQIKKKDIKLFCLNAIFRPSQLFFRPYGGFYRDMLKQFDYFFVQNEVSLAQLKQIGLHNATLVNDTRFDRVIQIARQRSEIVLAEKFSQNSITIVLGSVWPSDMELWYNLSELPVKLIIAPHEIKEAFLQEIENKISRKVVRFSQANAQSVADYQVLLIDNVGMLASMYCYGQLAYVGGGFHDGLHNTLEAAVFAKPVLFGNLKYQNFNEAVEMVALGCAFAVANSRELKKLIEEFLPNPDLILSLGQIARDYVESKSGGTQVILDHLETNLKIEF